MKFSKYLSEQAIAEGVKAFEDTVHYCMIQKGQLSTRDAINYLTGRLKQDNKVLHDLLDEILKNTK